MNFQEAKAAMEKGLYVKLPEWLGYWFMSDGQILVHTRSGEVKDTPWVDRYVDRTDWELTDGGEELRILSIAKVCHDTNKTFCEVNGDYSQLPWEEAAQWQRDSAVQGVLYRLANPEAPASAQHEAWMADKQKDGWVFGEVKDAEKKTHPCMVPYEELPKFQRQKDQLFQAIVDILK